MKLIKKAKFSSVSKKQYKASYISMIRAFDGCLGDRKR